jgi:hypothetical protein
MPVVPPARREEIGRIEAQSRPGQKVSETSSQQNKSSLSSQLFGMGLGCKAKMTEGVAQVIECFKCEALSSNPSMARETERERKEGTKEGRKEGKSHTYKIMK